MPAYVYAADGPDLVLGMMAASFAVFWMLFSGSPQALTATSVYYTCGARSPISTSLPSACNYMQTGHVTCPSAAGLAYEFTHYIVHTRVIPTSSWARVIRDNHVKHHMRNEDYWFAFTTPALDLWLGTAPHPSDVKVSELARSTRGP